MEELRPEEIKDLLKELEEEQGGDEAFRREARDDVLQRLEEAYAAEARDEFETALAKCDLAIQLDPGLAEAHNLRGIVLEELRRKLEAVAAYREAARLDPGSAEARGNLQELEAELKIQDWLRRYETEAAEGTQQQPSLLTPSEIILLHGDKFARTSSAAVELWGWVGFNVNALTLAAAFLANEQAGAVHLEVRQEKALFGLLRLDKLCALRGDHRISWPAHSLESRMWPLAGNYVSEIVADWLGGKYPSPWKEVGNRVRAELVSRGLLQKERKSGLKGLFAGESYVLPAETAALATQQSIEPIVELLETCRRTRPEVWRLLIEGINKGISKCTESDYDPW